MVAKRNEASKRHKVLRMQVLMVAKRNETKQVSDTRFCGGRGVCSGRESNPHGVLTPQVFETCLSTNSSTRALSWSSNSLAEPDPPCLVKLDLALRGRTALDLYFVFYQISSKLSVLTSHYILNWI
jgi:hypothetical protein